ncbi:MAG: S8 family serine peptidase [Lautropia sp.]
MLLRFQHTDASAAPSAPVVPSPAPRAAPAASRAIQAATLCALLLAICGCSSGGSDSTAGVPPPPVGGATGLANTNCPLTYSGVVAAAGSGSDPLLASQWHLVNDGAITGTAGIDLRATSAWSSTLGGGARIAIVDEAIEVTHQDIAPNIVPGASFDYRPESRGGAYPMPCSQAEAHGTAVTGIAVARDGNASGGAGVAPRAAAVAYNALATSLSADVVDALNRDLALNDVFSNSWGSADDGFLHPSRASFAEALRQGTGTGRNGKGSIYLFPSGNGGCYNPDLPSTPQVEACVRENSNFDGFVNKRGQITVCAVDSDGRQPDYGERGANLLVCAPSSGARAASFIRTTGLKDSYRADFSGTSASTPMVAGVVALMLAANPALTWRDVPMILARTARRTDATDPGWTTNFGLNHNHKYGFGLVDAAAAVALARTWTSVGGSTAETVCGPYANTVEQQLSDPVGASFSPVSNVILPAGCAITKIEFVEVGFTAKAAVGDVPHPSIGDLRIRLVSPAGLVSELADGHVCYDTALTPVGCGDYDDYVFGSVRHMDEPVAGAPGAGWTLEVTDVALADTGRFANWWIRFHGR